MPLLESSALRDTSVWTRRAFSPRGPHDHAEVAERQTRCVQGAVSARAWGFKSPPRHQYNRIDRAMHALVAQWIERYPAEVEAVRSSRTEVALILRLRATQIGWLSMFPEGWGSNL